MFCICPVDSVCLEDAVHVGGELLLFHSEKKAQWAIEKTMERGHKFKPYPVEISILPTQFGREK